MDALNNGELVKEVLTSAGDGAVCGILAVSGQTLSQAKVAWSQLVLYPLGASGLRLLWKLLEVLLRRKVPDGLRLLFAAAVGARFAQLSAKAAVQKQQKRAAQAAQRDAQARIVQFESSHRQLSSQVDELRLELRSQKSETERAAEERELYYTRKRAEFAKREAGLMKRMGPMKPCGPGQDPLSPNKPHKERERYETRVANLSDHIERLENDLTKSRREASSKSSAVQQYLELQDNLMKRSAELARENAQLKHTLKRERTQSAPPGPSFVATMPTPQEGQPGDDADASTNSSLSDDSPVDIRTSYITGAPMGAGRKSSNADQDTMQPLETDRGSENDSLFGSGDGERLHVDLDSNSTVSSDEITLPLRKRVESESSVDSFLRDNLARGDTEERDPLGGTPMREFKRRT